MTLKVAFNIILALLVAILGVVGYKLSPQHNIDAGLTLPVAACNPALDDCSVALPDGSIELSFSPRPIRPLQAFKARLRVRNLEVRSAEIDFEGTDMKMGYYRPPFNMTDGVLVADAILPVCVTGTMQWEATVMLTTPTDRIAIPFHFEVAGR